MTSTRKMDWEAAEAMQDKETMFLLYAVSEGLCQHINDFSKHFEESVEEEVQTLVSAGFIEESGGHLSITEKGRFVLGDLANATVPKEESMGKEDKNNIEFSSIPITKSLREAIRGAAELSEKSEEDFIHQTLAFIVGRIIQNKIEVVNLRGESVEEDFELLKYRYAMQKEGKKVRLSVKEGNPDNLDICLEAMSKMKEWLKDKEAIDVPVYDPFELLWKNIKHEAEWKMLRWEKLSELKDKKITSDEREKFLNEEERKYREERGYLQSEVPFEFVPGVQASALIPEILSESEQLLQLAETIETGNFSLWDALLYFFLLREGKRTVIKWVGKKRAKKILGIAKTRIRKALDEKIDKIEK
ncbi:MAG: hypothetical protein F4X75_13570 [Gemmatimonadetes bacterium]|nr:hypothetical protein [Gemmatimonadota bacterium]